MAERLTYWICQPETTITNALESILRASWSARRAHVPAQASLVILHNQDGLVLSPAILRFYHEGLGGSPKRLICIDYPGPMPACRDEAPAWLLRVTQTEQLVPDLVEWMDLPHEYRDRLPEPPTPDTCRDLIAQTLHVPMETLRRAPYIPEGFFNSDLISFYRSLCDICADYAHTAHGAYWSSDACLFSERGDDMLVLEELRERRFAQACEDLRKSLVIRVRPASGEQNSILLVDDHPEEHERDLAAIFRSFLPRFECWVCKLDPGQSDMTRFISQYRSGDHSRQEVLGILSDLQITRVYPPKAADRAELALPDALHKLRFVIMDQLFQANGTEGELLGPALTRGLSRLLRDGLSPRSIPTWELPEVIALSRVDDPEVIQHALRSGAKDYVLKSHLLTLPSVLARVQRGVSDPPRNLRRNFRALYRLPNETIGLLHSIKIPRISFHDPAERNNPVPAHTLGAQRCASEILEILPKPDLHVHVGSCMSTEFLVVASLLGLCRHTSSEVLRARLPELVSVFTHLLAGTFEVRLVEDLSPSTGIGETFGLCSGGSGWIKWLGKFTRDHVSKELRASAPRSRYSRFRALLHVDLRIPDFLTEEAAKKELSLKPDLELALFAVRHLEQVDASWDAEDLIRVYLLSLATRYRDEAGRIPTLKFGDYDFLGLFSDPTREFVQDTWDTLHGAFYSDAADVNAPTTLNLREAGWRWRHGGSRLKLTWPHRGGDADVTSSDITFEERPIEYELATGLRSENLADYLQGCEFSGAAHMRHPFLIHLFAQQVVVDFVRRGVFYAELKGSPDGYVNEKSGFEFAHVCSCLVQAFSQAQEVVLDVYHASRTASGRSSLFNDPRLTSAWVGDVLGERYQYAQLRELFCSEVAGKARGDKTKGRVLIGGHLPSKVSLIFVGKRHKGTSQLILEAAAAAVMRPSGDVPAASARDFVEREMQRCRVVGFDLAGQEVGHPPESFAQEFARLSRLHIPLTIHAGENAPARFIEDAVLVLRARRIGHGLALAEDTRLMTRMREDRICVELCPVCNHQTSHFTPSTEGGGRQYPLKRFLEHGLYVTINTDNPVISNTNLVKEYFQASYAYDSAGLSLWDALRLMRMGYVCSFLHLPERRAMIEMVEQYLWDLFSREDIVDYLRDFAALQRKNPLFCATSNPGKLSEFRLAAEQHGDALAWEIMELPGLENTDAPEETGTTIEENAVLKARYYSKLFPESLIVAEDSGLEVTALDGAPGVYSARFGGAGTNDALNNSLLLSLLEGAQDRTASFVCVLALAKSGNVIRTFQGITKGSILETRTGIRGFGYDPLFYHGESGLSFGEMTAEAKLRVSHRGRALRAMIKFLRGQSDLAATQTDRE